MMTLEDLTTDFLWGQGEFPKSSKMKGSEPCDADLTQAGNYPNHHQQTFPGLLEEVIL